MLPKRALDDLEFRVSDNLQFGYLTTGGVEKVVVWGGGLSSQRESARAIAV